MYRYRFPFFGFKVCRWQWRLNNFVNAECEGVRHEHQQAWWFLNHRELKIAPWAREKGGESPCSQKRNRYLPVSTIHTAHFKPPHQRISDSYQYRCILNWNKTKVLTFTKHRKHYQCSLQYFCTVVQCEMNAFSHVLQRWGSSTQKKLI